MRNLLLALQIPLAAMSYRPAMTRSAWRTFGPAAPVATLAGQIHQESGWKTTAKSWVGAGGLAQFMPATANDMARLYPEDCAPADPFSARWAFACRDRYMASLLKAIHPLSGTLIPCSQWAFALRAYNGGAGWVARARRKAVALFLDPDNWQAIRAVNPGQSPDNFRQNVEYPERIYRLSVRYVAAGWGPAVVCGGS